jgi:hypothetical protein
VPSDSSPDCRDNRSRFGNATSRKLTAKPQEDGNNLGNPTSDYAESVNTRDEKSLPHGFVLGLAGRFARRQGGVARLAFLLMPSS